MGIGVGAGEGANVGVNVGETVSVLIIGSGSWGGDVVGLGPGMLLLLGLLGGGDASSCVCGGKGRKSEKWG